MPSPPLPRRPDRDRRPPVRSHEGASVTAAAVPVLTRLSEHLLAARDRTSTDWSLPSACRGWSNGDVLIHLACTLRELSAPETLPAPVQDDIEATNEVQVAAFRGATIESAFADYAAQLPPALAQLQAPELSAETLSLENAGVYPVHLAAESLVFDHFCHLRHDLTMGPDALAPLSDDLCAEALHWAVRWLIAGLPQMSPPALADVITGPVALKLTGPGGGAWTIYPAPGGARRVAVATGVDASTIVGCSGDDFMRWGTKRQPWRKAGVRVRGDEALAEAVLDHIHVF